MKFKSLLIILSLFSIIGCGKNITEELYYKKASQFTLLINEEKYKEAIMLLEQKDWTLSEENSFVYKNTTYLPMEEFEGIKLYEDANIARYKNKRDLKEVVLLTVPRGIEIHMSKKENKDWVITKLHQKGGTF